jgi:hypothetical protein
MLIITCIGIAANLITSAMNYSSAQSIFGMINQIQLILLFPLIGTDIPEKVVNAIISMNLGIFSFEMSPLTEISLFNQPFSQLEIEQTKGYLYLIGLESGSSFYNIKSQLYTILTLIPIHITISLLYHITK